MTTFIPFVVMLSHVEASNHERKTARNQRAATFTPFDKLRTGFDRALLSNVEGLRANG